MTQKEIVNAFNSRDERLTLKEIGARLGIRNTRNTTLGYQTTQCVRMDRLKIVDVVPSNKRGGGRANVYMIHEECDLWED